jgi:hypothetical protein
VSRWHNQETWKSIFLSKHFYRIILSLLKTFVEVFFSLSRPFFLTHEKSPLRKITSLNNSESFHNQCSWDRGKSYYLFLKISHFYEKDLREVFSFKKCPQNQQPQVEGILKALHSSAFCYFPFCRKLFELFMRLTQGDKIFNILIWWVWLHLLSKMHIVEKSINQRCYMA